MAQARDPDAQDVDDDDRGRGPGLDGQGRRRGRRGRRRLRGDDRQGRHGGREHRRRHPRRDRRRDRHGRGRRAHRLGRGRGRRRRLRRPARPTPSPEPEPSPTPPRRADAPATAGAVRASQRREPSRPPDPAPAPTGPVAAVPRARGLARERGIDLATVTGDRARRPDPRRRRRGASSPRRRPRRPLAAGAAPAAPAARPPRPRTTRPSSDRKAAIRAAVARKMTPSAAIPQFTVWREVHLDAANAPRRRPVVDHRAAAGVRRRAARRARAAVPLGGRPGHRQRDRRPSRSPWPPTAGCWCRRSWSPTWATRASWTRRCATSSAPPTPASWTAPYMGVANGSLSNLGGAGRRPLPGPPDAAAGQRAVARVDPAAAGGRPRRRRAGPHRRRPASPSTTGWPTGRTRRSCCSRFVDAARRHAVTWSGQQEVRAHTLDVTAVTPLYMCARM